MLVPQRPADPQPDNLEARRAELAARAQAALGAAQPALSQSAPQDLQARRAELMARAQRALNPPPEPPAILQPGTAGQMATDALSARLAPRDSATDQTQAPLLPPGTPPQPVSAPRVTPPSGLDPSAFLPTGSRPDLRPEPVAPSSTAASAEIPAPSALDPRLLAGTERVAPERAVVAPAESTARPVAGPESEDEARARLEREAEAMQRALQYADNQEVHRQAAQLRAARDPVPGFRGFPVEPTPEGESASLGQRAMNAFNAAVSTYLPEIPASILGGAAQAAKWIDERLPEGARFHEGSEVHEMFVSQLADAIRAEAQRRFPTDPTLQGRFVEDTLPRAIGSFGAFLTGGGAARAAGGSAGGFALTAAVTGGADQMYREARAMGADEDTARLAGALGTLPGAIQVFPVMQALGRFNRAAGGGVSRTWMEALKQGGLGALEEAVVETTGQVGFNEIARRLYDEDRELYDGLVDAAGAGGVAGFLASALLTAAGGRAGAPRAALPRTPQAEPQVAPQAEADLSVLRERTAMLFQAAREGRIDPERVRRVAAEQFGGEIPADLLALLDPAPTEAGKADAPTAVTTTDGTAEPLPLARLEGRRVRYEGVEGTLRRDEEGTYVVDGRAPDGRPVVFEVADAMKDPAADGRALGLESLPPVVSVGRDNVVVRGRYGRGSERTFSLPLTEAGRVDPAQVLNEDGDGNLVSVTLNREDGRPVTIRDPEVALEVALGVAVRQLEGADFSAVQALLDPPVQAAPEALETAPAPDATGEVLSMLAPETFALLDALEAGGGVDAAAADAAIADLALAVDFARRLPDTNPDLIDGLERFADDIIAAARPGEPGQPDGDPPSAPERAGTLPPLEAGGDGAAGAMGEAQTATLDAAAGDTGDGAAAEPAADVAVAPAGTLAAMPEAAVQDLGFSHPRHALNSVNARLGTEYESLADVPEADVRAAAEARQEGRTERVPVAELQVDPARFQPREQAFSEESVRRIVERFDERELDPIRTWTDPETGETFVLAGHSRLEAIQRLQEIGQLPDDYAAPVDPYQGSEAEAIDFAHRENLKGTAQTPVENAGVLRRWMGEQADMTKAALREHAQSLFGRNANMVTALAHLNPDGEAMGVVRMFGDQPTADARAVLTMAQYVGLMRQRHPELTNRHEREIFRHLRQHYGDRPWTKNQAAFQDYIDRAVEKRAEMGEGGERVLPDVLNLENLTGRSQAELEIDAQVQEARQALREAQQERARAEQDFVGRGGEGDALAQALRPFDEAVRVAQRDLLRVEQEAQRARSAVMQSEQSLFDSLFDLADRPGEGLPTIPALREALQPLVDQFQGVPVELVDTEADLPASVRADVERAGHTGRVRGAMDPRTGISYVVLDMFADVDQARRTLLEEVVGHAGVRAVLGERAAEVFDRIYRDVSSTPEGQGELEGLAARYRLDLETEAGRRTAAEEYVAKLARMEPEATLVQRVVAALREALRRLGIERAYTDGDLVALIARARDRVSRAPEGRAEARTEAVAYALAPAQGWRAGRGADTIAEVGGEVFDLGYLRINPFSQHLLQRLASGEVVGQSFEIDRAQVLASVDRAIQREQGFIETDQERLARERQGAAERDARRAERSALSDDGVSPLSQGTLDRRHARQARIEARMAESEVRIETLLSLRQRVSEMEPAGPDIRYDLADEQGASRQGDGAAPDLDAFLAGLGDSDADLAAFLRGEQATAAQEAPAQVDPAQGDGAAAPEPSPDGVPPAETTAPSPEASEAEAQMRGFAERVSEDARLEEAVRTGVAENPRSLYHRISNVQTADEANALFREEMESGRGYEGVVQAIMDRTNRIPYRVRIALGGRTILAMNAEAQAAREAGNEAGYQDATERAVALSEFMAELGTELGQGVQAFRMWAHLTPDGKLLALTRAISRTTVRVRQSHSRVNDKVREATNRAVEVATDDILGRLDQMIRRLEADRAKMNKPKQPRTGPARTFEQLADEFGVVIRDIVLKHYTAQDAGALRVAEGAEGIRLAEAREQRVEQLSLTLQDAGLTLNEAQLLAGRVQTAFELAVGKHRERILKNRLAARDRRKAEKPGDRRQVYERIVELSNLGAISDARYDGLLDEVYQIPPPTEAQRAEMIRRTDEMQRLINQTGEESTMVGQAAADLMAWISNQKGVDLADSITAYYYANMLSGPRTQLINVFDTTVNIGLETIIALRHVPQSPQIFASFLSGLAAGVPQGARAARGALRGEGVHRYSGKYDLPSTHETVHKALMRRLEDAGIVPPDPTLDPVAWGKYLVRAAGELSNRERVAWGFSLGRWVFRTLSATDAFLFNVSREGRSHLMAAKLAHEEGLSGRDLRRAVSDRMHGTQERLDAAREQAEADVEAFGQTTMGERTRGETWTTAQRARLVEARVFEILDAARPREVRAEATRFAERMNYLQAPEGAMGVVSELTKKGIRQLRIETRYGDAEIARLVVPFVHIIGNVVQRNMDFVPPIGITRGMKGRNIFGAEEVSPAYSTLEAGDRAAAGTLGLTIWATVMALATLSLDEEDPEKVFAVHGFGPTNFDQRRQLFESGWKPYSIQIGKTFFVYKETPLAVVLASSGGYFDHLRYAANPDENTALESLSYGLAVSGGVFLESSFLGGISDVLDMIGGRSPGGPTWTSFGQGVAGNLIPGAGLLREAARIAHPEARDYRSDMPPFFGRIMAQMPMTKPMMGLPALNALGEPIESSVAQRLPSDRVLGRRVEDEVWNYLFDNRLWIPVPKDPMPIVFGSSRAARYMAENVIEERLEDLADAEAGYLTYEQYHRFMKARGEIIRTEMERRIRPDAPDTFVGLPREIVQESINRIAADARSEAIFEALDMEYVGPTLSPERRLSRQVRSLFRAGRREEAEMLMDRLNRMLRDDAGLSGEPLGDEGGLGGASLEGEDL